jgi:hypothetical protein
MSVIAWFQQLSFGAMLDDVKRIEIAKALEGLAEQDV